MAALLSHLEQLVAEGRSELELVRAAEDELMGGDLLDEELADAARVVGQAEELALSLDVAALADAHRGGLYVPQELAELEPTRGVEWQAREALRFSCFAVLLRHLQQRARREAAGDQDFSSTITELAQRLARIRIHTPDEG